MDSSHKAFTLLELMVVLAITLIGLLFVMPSIGGVLQAQRLKYDLTRFKSVIDNTRDLSARTECDAEVTFTNQQITGQGTATQIQAEIKITKATQGECGTWFASTGLNSDYTNQFDLPGAQLQESPLSFRFTGRGSVVQRGLGQAIVFLRGDHQAVIQVRPEGFSTAEFIRPPS